VLYQTAEQALIPQDLDNFTEKHSLLWASPVTGFDGYSCIFII
jgi:hypothetical protein